MRARSSIAMPGSHTRGDILVVDDEPTIGEVTRAVAPEREPVVTGEWRAGDVRHVFASVAAAAERLGFRAAEDFEAGMREFAEAPLRT